MNIYGAHDIYRQLILSRTFVTRLSQTYGSGCLDKGKFGDLRLRPGSRLLSTRGQSSGRLQSAKSFGPESSAVW
jgi:hypothetical protein